MVPMSKFAVVNTVNTKLNRLYDFGVHSADCQDAKKAEKLGCQIYSHDVVTAEDAVQIESDDLAADFGEDHGFEFKIFPCCKNA